MSWVLRVGLLALLVCSCAVWADQPKKKRKPTKDMPTLMCERGKLLLSEDFSGEALSETWKPVLGDWKVEDGALKGVELQKDDHAAVIQYPLEYKNIVAQFCVMFDGGKGTSFSCNKTGLGHVCRVSITPTGLSLYKDKPSKESAEEGRLLDAQKVELKKGEWYTVVVEILGEEMVASITTPDGRHTVTAFGEDPRVGDEKTNFALPVSGEAIYFDDVRVWEAEPSKKWKTAKKKLEYLRKVQQAREAARQQK